MRSGERRCCQAAAAVRNSAPRKPVKKTGFSMTSLMFRITSTKVRSSLRPSAGMTAHEKTKKVPAIRPVATAAAPRTMRWSAVVGRSGPLVFMDPVKWRG